MEKLERRGSLFGHIQHRDAGCVGQKMQQPEVRNKGSSQKDLQVGVTEEDAGSFSAQQLQKSCNQRVLWNIFFPLRQRKHLVTDYLFVINVIQNDTTFSRV